MSSLRALIGSVAVGALVLAGGTASAASYTIDNSHSTVLFKLTHFNLSHFYGWFNRVEGELTYDDAAPEKSALTMSIPTKSIFTADKKRDDHLKSPDFFNVKQFPTITFKSTSVTAAGAGRLKVTGELTLLGKTKTITVDAVKVGEGADPWGGTRIGFDATFSISRAAWGLGPGFPPEALGDDVTLTVALEAIKKK